MSETVFAPPANGTAEHQAQPSGRDNRGRFGAGNREGHGNPFARQVAVLRNSFLYAVTPEEMAELGKRIIHRTKRCMQQILAKKAAGGLADALADAVKYPDAASMAARVAANPSMPMVANDCQAGPQSPSPYGGGGAQATAVPPSTNGLRGAAQTQEAPSTNGGAGAEMKLDSPSTNGGGGPHANAGPPSTDGLGGAAQTQKAPSTNGRNGHARGRVGSSKKGGVGSVKKNSSLLADCETREA